MLTKEDIAKRIAKEVGISQSKVSQILNQADNQPFSFTLNEL